MVHNNIKKFISHSIRKNSKQMQLKFYNNGNFFSSQYTSFYYFSRNRLCCSIHNYLALNMSILFKYNIYFSKKIKFKINIKNLWRNGFIVTAKFLQNSIHIDSFHFKSEMIFQSKLFIHFMKKISLTLFK